ncbi:MAG: M81 family metallopeptidase [Gaiellaceae bacterium MAG52_C11]|nr:M81 family metallopeptidase [Candidatus Gaiellasilicea maunaloa]
MRVGVVGLWHETNTYSARATSLREFEAFEFLRGDDVFRRHAGTATVIGGMLESTDLELVPILSAGAWPAGPVTQDALEAIFGAVERELEAARPLDGLLLNLHGAMVGEQLGDPELELVQRLRAELGEVAVAAVLDLHGNPSPALIELCDAIVAYDTYPHIDMRARGREAARLLAEIIRGRALRTFAGKVPLLSSPLAQATDERPMRELKARAQELADQTGVARISLLPGFPYSDVERAGFTILVTSERKDEATARDAVATLMREVEALRDEFKIVRDDPVTAVSRALEARKRPVVLVDVADNVGGGAPGDGTALLAELLDRGATGAVVPVADEGVAREAARVGAGGTLRADVGGKTDAWHGSPVPIVGRVDRVTDGRYRSTGSWMTGQEFSMGTTAVLDVNGATLVVTERAVPPFHAEQLLSVGIDPREAAVLVVKGAIAWRAAYGDIAGTVIEVDTPGICPLDPTRLQRKTMPMRLDPHSLAPQERSDA